MRGAWPSTAMQAAWQQVSSNVNAVPAPVNQLVIGGAADGAVGGAPSIGEAGSFAISYQMQTGPTRYAPMQPKPPSAITATATNPLNPTSHWTLATTFLPLPIAYGIQTTITEPANYAASTSRENTVCFSLRYAMEIKADYDLGECCS